eukprot:5604116-Prymnesium_polylepis.1
MPQQRLVERVGSFGDAAASGGSDGLPCPLRRQSFQPHWRLSLSLAVPVPVLRLQAHKARGGGLARQHVASTARRRGSPALGPGGAVPARPFRAVPASAKARLFQLQSTDANVKVALLRVADLRRAPRHFALAQRCGHEAIRCGERRLQVAPLPRVLGWDRRRLAVR